MVITRLDSRGTAEAQFKDCPTTTPCPTTTVAPTITCPPPPTCPPNPTCPPQETCPPPVICPPPKDKIFYGVIAGLVLLLLGVSAYFMTNQNKK